MEPAVMPMECARIMVATGKAREPIRGRAVPAPSLRERYAATWLCGLNHVTARRYPHSCAPLAPTDDDDMARDVTTSWLRSRIPASSHCRREPPPPRARLVYSASGRCTLLGVPRYISWIVLHANVRRNLFADASSLPCIANKPYVFLCSSRKIGRNTRNNRRDKMYWLKECNLRKPFWDKKTMYVKNFLMNEPFVKNGFRRTFIIHKIGWNNK